MEDRGIIDIYESANEKQTEQFKKNIDSKLRVQTDYEKVIKDTDWIEKMEEVIPYIDNIFRNPNRFIINEEEIVKIERARKITVDSIKHLTKNTNFIQEIDKKTGDVKPSKILNINKEESYDTYENRLIYTLVQNMKFFISKKKKTIEQFSGENGGNKNSKRIEYNGTSKASNQKVNINLSLDTAIDTEGEAKAENDTTQLLERIERLEVRISDLTTSDVYKVIDKKHITLITGPIKKTNVVLKNVNFQYAMRMWTYLQENLEDKTQNINEKSDYEDSGELKNLIDDSFYLQYLIVNTLDKEQEEELKDYEKEKQVQEIVISKMLEKVVDMNSDMTKKELQSMVGEKYAIIKYRNMVTMQEIQKIFTKNIDNYLNKVNK